MSQIFHSSELLYHKIQCSSTNEQGHLVIWIHTEWSQLTELIWTIDGPKVFWDKFDVLSQTVKALTESTPSLNNQHYPLTESTVLLKLLRLYINRDFFRGHHWTMITAHIRSMAACFIPEHSWLAASPWSSACELSDAAATFSFASSTSNKAEHVSQRETHREDADRARCMEFHRQFSFAYMTHKTNIIRATVRDSRSLVKPDTHNPLWTHKHAHVNGSSKYQHFLLF